MTQGLQKSLPKKGTTSRAKARSASAQPKKGQRVIPAKKQNAVAQARTNNRLGTAHRKRTEALLLARAKGTVATPIKLADTAPLRIGKENSGLGSFKLVQPDPLVLRTGQVAKERRRGSGTNADRSLGHSSDRPLDQSELKALEKKSMRATSTYMH